jgi:hypothetical protein
MRIISFSKKWDKLKQPEFTTFRVPRKDKDWQIGEDVTVYYHNRCKDREYLGVAHIIAKENRWVSDIRNDEAIADGFPNGKEEMWGFLIKSHKGIEARTPINKLTLRWTLND